MTNYLLASFGKVVFVLLLLALWTIYVGEQAAKLLTLFQWFLSQSFYPLVTFQTAQLILDTAFFFSTFKILLWIFAPGAHDVDQTEKAGSMTQTKKGWTTRSLYS